MKQILFSLLIFKKKRQKLLIILTAKSIQVELHDPQSYRNKHGITPEC